MKYLDIHFKIEAGYVWGRGMAANRIADFDAEVVALFVGAGWQIKESEFAACSPEVVLGKNRLYLHPMEISGELDAELVPVVEALLKQGKTFKLVEVRKIGELVDLSDEDYLELLKGKRSEIEAALLAAFARGDVSGQRTVEAVKERYHVDRLVAHIGRGSRDPEWRYVQTVFDELVACGKLVVSPLAKYCYRLAA